MGGKKDTGPLINMKEEVNAAKKSYAEKARKWENKTKPLRLG
jgi:hypothetical protein